MSQVMRCDYQGCVNDYVAVRIVDKVGSFLDFCTPEHAVLWLFAEYPDMPMWYGPKREMERDETRRSTDPGTFTRDGLIFTGPDLSKIPLGDGGIWSREETASAKD